MARISETDAVPRVFLTGLGISGFVYQAAKRPQAATAEVIRPSTRLTATMRLIRVRCPAASPPPASAFWKRRNGTAYRKTKRAITTHPSACMTCTWTPASAKPPKAANTMAFKADEKGNKKIFLLP